jgi:hypothetical protein
LRATAHARRPVATEVVLASLQHRHAHALGARGDRRGVLAGQLVLEVLGGGGDDDALAGHRGRDEIGERLANAGAGLDHGGRASREGGRDRADHLTLALATLPATGKIVRDEVEQGERAIGVDRLDVLIELHSALGFGLDVGDLLVGIETLHRSTLEGGADRFARATN